MRLYLLRHADALPDANDAIRPLSKLGHRQARAMAEFLAGAGIHFDAAYSSPLTRAQQTAELVLPITNRNHSILLELKNDLLNEAPDFQGWLRKLPARKHVLLVGHNPSLSQHAAELLGLRATPALDLSKGSLACIKVAENGAGELKFWLTPRLLGVE